ncbi:MAG: anthranilate phosphoribosyltransferase, partial [Pseudomonadota bacterium]
DHVMVIHGSDGLDELTTTGPSFVSELKNGQITSYEVTPEDVGLSRAQPEDLRGGTADENATALRDILNGTKNAYRDIVLLNAAAALRVAGVEPTLADGVKRAAVAIDSGAGLATLEALVAQSHQSAAE